MNSQSINKRAWSDGPDHVIVRIGNDEHGMDLDCALELSAHLQDAIQKARNPFDVWFESLTPYVNSDYSLCGDIKLTKSQAKIIWDRIINWK